MKMDNPEETVERIRMEKRQELLNRYLYPHFREDQFLVIDLPLGWLVYFTYMPHGIQMPDRIHYWDVSWVKVRRLPDKKEIQQVLGSKISQYEIDKFKDQFIED